MTAQYDHLRPEKVQNFNYDIFILNLESLSTFNKQLEFFDEYFDLWEIQKSHHITIKSGELTHYVLYCETDICNNQEINTNLEKQKGLATWRQKRISLLKLQFEELKIFQERIDFCLKYFGVGSTLNHPPGVATFLADDVSFSNLPIIQKDWQLNNRLFYEWWDNIFSTNQISKYTDKSFTRRRINFEARITKAIHPDEELESEIKRIKWEFQRSEDSAINESSSVYFFRQRLSGILLNFPDHKTDTFLFVNYILPLIEAQHAYHYYKYLVELQRSPKTFRGGKISLPIFKAVATQENAMSAQENNPDMTSYVIPDKTLVDWLFEAMSYDSFIDSRSLYEQELIYYRAIQYRKDMEAMYEASYPIESRNHFEVFSEIQSKLKAETKYEEAGQIIKRLRTIVGYQVVENGRSLFAPNIDQPQPGTKLPSNQPSAPILSIVPSTRQVLYDALKLHVEKAQHSALLVLICENKPPESPIIFAGSVKTFGGLFYKVKAVPDQGAKILSEQLPNYFLRSVGGRIETLKPQGLVKELRGAEERRRENDKK